ncbi:dipeptidase PepE [Chitinophaga barathri]|uniref:Dipeptidase PepE n=1 Tax=Chitinophaga barathri TaxID=1647451 RepID=A0A3N4MF47_9BACT|nr:dipeptidase PepE [Chitinophaga barathri]RPD38269.1 dipeptidase PepE [Chitinophaga barathri]
MQKKIVLASTSTLFGQQYLEYLEPVIAELFAGLGEVVFIPYARPGGISHDDYTHRAAGAFEKKGIRVKGLHTFEDPLEGIRNAQAFFTGGGNTFLLVKQLHDLGLMGPLAGAVNAGKPYLGCSAGSNIGGVNMQTTNDMPIVYPPSFSTMGLVPFNLNPHYLDPVAGLEHMGETRETRIKEFHTQNNIPVIGLREGNWIAMNGEDITLEGAHNARIFLAGKEPYELPAGERLSFS